MGHGYYTVFGYGCMLMPTQIRLLHNRLIRQNTKDVEESGDLTTKNYYDIEIFFCDVYELSCHWERQDTPEVMFITDQGADCYDARCGEGCTIGDEQQVLKWVRQMKSGRLESAFKELGVEDASFGYHIMAYQGK